MINQNQIQRHLPGQRILKTSIAVTLCLLYYMLRGRQGETMPAEAAITAIICMQSDLHDTRKSGFSRLAGTVIGAVWGFLFLLLMALRYATGPAQRRAFSPAGRLRAGRHRVCLCRHRLSGY